MASPEFTSADNTIFAEQAARLQDSRQEQAAFRAQVRETLDLVVDSGELIMVASGSQDEADRDIAYDIVLYQLSGAMDYPLKNSFARQAAAELYASATVEEETADEQ